jgi:hypothetical protein
MNTNHTAILAVILVTACSAAPAAVPPSEPVLVSTSVPATSTEFVVTETHALADWQPAIDVAVATIEQMNRRMGTDLKLNQLANMTIRMISKNSRIPCMGTTIWGGCNRGTVIDINEGQNVDAALVHELMHSLEYLGGLETDNGQHTNATIWGATGSDICFKSVDCDDSVVGDTLKSLNY